MKVRFELKSSLHAKRSPCPHGRISVGGFDLTAPRTMPLPDKRNLSSAYCTCRGRIEFDYSMDESSLPGPSPIPPLPLCASMLKATQRPGSGPGPWDSHYEASTQIAGPLGNAGIDNSSTANARRQSNLPPFYHNSAVRFSTQFSLVPLPPHQTGILRN